MTTIPRDEPLSPVDAAWLRMDRPTNLMAITALVELDGRLSLRELEEVVAARLLPHARFSQRVVERWGRPWWSRDPHFTLATHLHRVGLPPPGDAAALRELVSDLMSTPLERSHPLWQLHLVETGPDSSAIVVRLHHCIADGVALVRLLLSLTDHDGGAGARDVGARPAAPRGLRGRLRLAADAASALVHDLALPPDPDSRLRGRLGVRKVAAWSAPAPLAQVSAAAHAAGGTVTDVLMAAIAGALRRRLDERGDPQRGHELRALVPVNLRGLGADSPAGNRFGMVYLPLPLATATPAERLAQVHERMERIKASPEAAVGLGVIGAMGLVSAAMERFGIELFTRKATAMITSLPGPSAPVRLAGHPVRHLLVWAPASGQIAVTFSLLSYAGSIQLGVATDRQVIADPEGIVAGYEQELAALTRGARRLERAEAVTSAGHREGGSSAPRP